MTVHADTQVLSPGRMVILYALNLTALGGTIYRFCSSFHESAPVQFQGYTYTPVPIIAEGFESNAQGPLARPTLSISNVDSVMMSAVITYDDIVGARVVRWKTFSHYLDGQPNADPDSHFPVEIYYVERKTRMDDEVITWELSSELDKQGQLVPRRRMLQRTCTLDYRIWNGTAFDYSKTLCPYRGSAYFKIDGTPTANPAEDRCSHDYEGGTLRFNENENIPCFMFPGLSRVRLR